MPKPERVFDKKACFLLNKINGLASPRHINDGTVFAYAMFVPNSDDNDYQLRNPRNPL